jgi:hypothetical protein
LTPAQYNEYYTLNSGIKEYYEKTINGVDPSNKQKADLSPKYVLKYEYNPDNDALKNIFAGMGYYKQEIVMESSAVAVSGNVVTVTIPKENLMTGETYTVTTDTGIVKDIVGLKSKDIATKTFTTGNKPQPPVIRVNKISGRGETAKTTTVKIHTVTNGELEILECEISPNSKNSGKMLKEISAPGKYLVLLHKKVSSNSYEIPDGNSQLYSGDRIVLITQADFTKKTLSFFSEE